MSRTARAFLVLPTLAYFIAAALTGCSSQATPTPAPAPKVSIAAALERDVTEWDEFTGRLEAVESVEIRPRVTGYIESVHFTEGGLVKKGDLLFVIDPRPYQAEFDRAKAELTRAEAHAKLADSDLTRTEKLLSIKAASHE